MRLFIWALFDRLQVTIFQERKTANKNLKDPSIVSATQVGNRAARPHSLQSTGLQGHKSVDEFDGSHAGDR